MNNRKFILVLILITILGSDLIILLDLENFGNSYSMGGFAMPYGFMIKFLIFIFLCVLSIMLFIFKKIFKVNIKVFKTILILFVTAILVYIFNLLIFFNFVENRYDLDGDGLSNDYERKIKTNLLLKNDEVRNFEMDEEMYDYVSEFKKDKMVNDIKINIVGKGDYLWIFPRFEKFYNVGNLAINNGMMYDYFLMSIENFYYGDQSGLTYVEKFNSLNVKICLNANYNTDDYYPATYIIVGEKMHSKGFSYYDLDAQLLDYKIDYNQNCYDVSVPYELYSKNDLYKIKDEIYIGLMPKF